MHSSSRRPPVTQEEAFIAEIAERPDDDGPRLVFADWLEDHGDPARAEFIRVQCELARIEEDDDRRIELKRREGQLLKEHSDRWTAGLEEVADSWRFDRGLIEHLRVPRPGEWLQRVDEVVRRFPVRSIHTTDEDGCLISMLTSLHVGR